MNAHTLDTIPVPEETASTSLTLSQKLTLLCLLLFLGYIIFHHLQTSSYWPHHLLAVVYAVICFHKFFLILRGLVKKQETIVSDVEIFSRHDWPVYSILLPLYRETEILPQLCQAIEKIDYPKDRLEVILILEEDDVETQRTVEKMSLPFWWRTIIVPDFPPKTKGKALNYGLAHAHGRYLVIYDAEDIPEPTQLKKAVIGFQRADPQVVCLQAKLNYYNPYQNILTKWFTAEYSTWFDLYLPGISSIQAPIPLGGTSNHFRTEVLRQLKGWDPFNVTEDCDLGIRIFKAGYRTAVLDTTTWEEANSQLGNWIKQRSRWVKGYIQTYFVHTRNPWQLLTKLGVVNFIHFNLIVGGNFFVLCFNPVAWFLFFWCLFSGLKTGFFPQYNKPFDTLGFALYLGNIAFILINVAGCLKRKYHRLLIPSLLSPFYWILMSIGAWKGLWQYFFRPHFWEKTAHALFPAGKILTTQESENTVQN